MIQRQEITIIRGTTNMFSVALTDVDGNPYALGENEILRFGIKADENSTQYLIEKSVDSSALIEGGYVVTLTPDDTEALAFGNYLYDVGVQSGGAYFNVIPCSRFAITRNITRREVSA